VTGSLAYYGSDLAPEHILDESFFRFFMWPDRTKSTLVSRFCRIACEW